MSSSTTRSGSSLAKGPAAILGLALLAYGVTGLIFGSSDFTEQAFDGTVSGEEWLGIEANGWSNLLFAAAGGLLVLSAPFHWTAKTVAMITGLVLGSVALIALGDGDDALGIFAANDATLIAWGASAVLLLVTALMPRTRRSGEPADERVRGDDRGSRGLPRYDEDRESERLDGAEAEHTGRRRAGHRPRDGELDRPRDERPAEYSGTPPR